MKFNDISKVMKTSVNKFGLALKDKSPEILMGVGIVGVIGAGVVACVATAKKLPDVKEEHKQKLDDIHQYEEETGEKAGRALTKAYAGTALKVAATYAPAVALGSAAIGCIIASNDILRKRNAALAATVVAVESSFANYRKRVVDRFGEEVDYQLQHGIDEVTVTETDEKGKEHKKKYEIAHPDESGNPYTKYFTRSNPYWEDNEDYLTMFFNSEQNYANDLLHAKGHVTLNEVYKRLGFKENKVGMIAGWIDDPKHPESDGYIEFSIRKVHITNENGVLEDAYAIDFNVDGDIYKRMA